MAEKCPDCDREKWQHTPVEDFPCGVRTSKAMNVHELVADLIACALIEGNSGRFPAEQQTKAAKQRLLDEIERRSSEMRHLKAHGNETSEPRESTAPAGTWLCGCKPPANITSILSTGCKYCGAVRPVDPRPVCPQCGIINGFHRESCPLRPSQKANDQHNVTGESK